MELLKDADLVQLLGRSRTTGDVNTWWGNSAYQQLDHRLGGSLSRASPPTSPLPHHTLTLEMGFDFGQMYDWTNEGMGVLAVR